MHKRCKRERPAAVGHTALYSFVGITRMKVKYGRSLWSIQCEVNVQGAFIYLPVVTIERFKSAADSNPSAV